MRSGRMDSSLWDVYRVGALAPSLHRRELTLGGRVTRDRRALDVLIFAVDRALQHRHGQPDLEAGTAQRARLVAEPPAVLLGDHVVRDRQTLTRACADALGREEGIEDLIADTGIDARA